MPNYDDGAVVASYKPRDDWLYFDGDWEEVGSCVEPGVRIFGWPCVCTNSWYVRPTLAAGGSLAEALESALPLQMILTSCMIGATFLH